MKLSPSHALALAGAACLSAIAVSDAVTYGVTGHNTAFADHSGSTGLIIAGSVVHGVTYAALGWVLVRETDRFAAANKVARIARVTLIGSLGILTFGMLAVAPVVQLTDQTDGPLGMLWVVTASIGFAGMILSSLALGCAVLRTNPLGYGGRVLRALPPITLLTVAVGFLAPRWAHPAYMETTIAFGIALVGVNAKVTARPANVHDKRLSTTG